MASQSTTPLAAGSNKTNPLALAPRLPATGSTTAFAQPTLANKGGGLLGGLAQGAANLVSPSQGNVAVNQTTASGGSQIPNFQSLGIGTMNPTTHAMTPNTNLGGGADTPPMGAQAVSPTHNLAPAAPASISGNQQVQKPATPAIDYTLHNGESTDAYNTRIAQAQGTTNQPAPVNTTGGSQGLGTGGGQAPAGMEYGPNGQLQPMQGPGGLPGQAPTNPNYQPGQKYGLITSAPQPGESQADWQARMARESSNNPQPYTVNNGLYGQLITGLANKANQPSADYTAQQGAANATLDQIKQLQTNQATQQANLEGSPIDLSLATGQEGILNRLAASKQAALSSQYQGQTNLLSAANTQQGLQQSGLNQAAGLVAPQLGQYGQAQYSPLGGTVGGGTGAGVSPSDPFYQTMQTYAQALATGQGTAIPGSISGNPALQAQLLQMAQQINPNFNYNQSTATGQSQQQQTGQTQQYQSAAKQAQNLGLQLQQIVTQAGINPNDVNGINSFVQKVANNTSDLNYATFQNLISDLASTYAQVLTPAGGAVTDKVRDISSSLLNATQSGQSILQVMKNLDAQVQAKIAGTQTAYGTNTNTTSAASGGANPWH